MNSRGEYLTYHPKFSLACLGGTFDQFHKGHKFFLEKAFEVSKKVIIGITDDNFAKKKFLPQAISSLEKRKEELKNFLKKKGFLKRAEIIEIKGAFHPRILDPKINCLVVSKKTREKAKFLNQARAKRGLPPLQVVEVPLFLDKEGKCLSGTRVRLGEINRKGELIVEKKFFKKVHLLPPKLRIFLKKPLGELILGKEKDLQDAAIKIKKRLKSISPTLLFTVGDVVTLSLMKEGILPALSIVDFKVKRKQIYQNISQLGFPPKMRLKEVKNEAGTLNPDLFLVIKRGVRNFLLSSKKIVIRVLGEEDLAAIPAVLLSPLSSLVFYGQPGKGIVAIKVTEKEKERFKEIVLEFQEKRRE